MCNGKSERHLNSFAEGIGQTATSHAGAGGREGGVGADVKTA